MSDPKHLLNRFNEKVADQIIKSSMQEQTDPQMSKETEVML